MKPRKDGKRNSDQMVMSTGIEAKKIKQKSQPKKLAFIIIIIIIILYKQIKPKGIFQKIKSSWV